MVMDNLGKIVIALVSVGLILVIGFLVMAEVKTEVISVDSVNESDASTLSDTYNATTETISAIEDIPGWLPIIVITMIGAILIGLVGFFRKGR